MAQTLADEFLADMEDETPPPPPTSSAPAATTTEGDNNDEEDVEPETVVKLFGSSRVASLLERVTRGGGGGGETDDDRVAEEANAVASELQGDVAALHRYVRERYGRRFPELESLVPSAADYARAVRAIGNAAPSAADAADALAAFLPQATAMGVAISASAARRGRPLGPATLARVVRACDMLADLDAARRALAAFVEQRAQRVAPNICAVVGCAVAARLLVAAGGVAQLARMPAGQLQLLGQRSPAGGAAFGLQQLQSQRRPHMGYIEDCDAVRSVPPEKRMHACRVVAGKCALAARVDAASSSSSSRQQSRQSTGEVGRELREYVDAHLEKELAPPPVRQDRALPAPDEKPKKRRGGRRLRHQKARYEMTEIRRQANRVAFSVDTPEDSSVTGHGFGMLGTLAGSGSGSVRAAAAVEKGILRKVKMDAARAGIATAASSRAQQLTSALSGLTSVAFAPTQGMELADPTARAAGQRTAALEREGYFSSVAQFGHVPSSSSLSGAAVHLPPPAKRAAK